MVKIILTALSFICLDFPPHCISEAKCKVFVMKISFRSYANKTNFHMKSMAISVSFSFCPFERCPGLQKRR